MSTTHFPAFAESVNKRLNELSKAELFVVDSDTIYEQYIFAFPEGTNPIYRTNTEHECSCCKQFIRNMGVVFGISADGKRQSLWDIPDLPYPYSEVAKALDAVVQQAPIKGVFRTKEGAYGVHSNFDMGGDRPIKHHHFFGTVASRFRCESPDQAKGEKKTTQQVLRRGLEELTADSVQTVLDLISSNALYRGAEHLTAVQNFRSLQIMFERTKDKDLFVWANIDSPAARFRNTAIGTLVQDLSEGVDLERAVRSFESKVAPTNYKRTTALVTQAMVEKDRKKLAELGLDAAIERRFARPSDVSVNDVLFTDAAVRAVMPGNDPWEGLSNARKPKHDSNSAQNASLDGFLMLLAASQPTKLEVLLKNAHLKNFVSLTAPVHPSTGQLFKWGNDFAWSYDGEVTDSIKERVKRAGGNTSAALRVSLAWFNRDDLDIHADTPEGTVYYGNKRGVLDVDMNVSNPRTDAVENLSWTKPKDGRYVIKVNQFNARDSGNPGFMLELETNGVIQQFTYGYRVSGDVKCISFHMKGGVLSDLRIEDRNLVGGSVPTEKWGVKTEDFVPVSILMTSPNHWEGAGEVGNKHLFFMLQGCQNPEPVRGIYNEFLRGDLTEHRKVFEILGSRTKCQPANDQLSGVGFSSGRGDELTVRVTDSKGKPHHYNITF